MKKIVLIFVSIIVIFVGAETASADTVSLYVNPSVYGIVGSEDIFRGVAGAVDVRLGLFDVFYPGIQALVEYDSYLSTTNIPIFLTLGFENIWIGAGQAFLTSTPTLVGVSYKYADFPNTFLIGGGIPIFPLGEKSKIKIGWEVTWTRMLADKTNVGVLDQYNDVQLLIAGLKAYVGVTFQLGF